MKRLHRAAAGSFRSCRAFRVCPSPAREGLRASPSRTKWPPSRSSLPKPMFVGTPQTIAVRRTFRSLSGKPRPRFSPPGTRTSALGKTGHELGHRADFLAISKLNTDDDKEAPDGSFVRAGRRLQHVRFASSAPSRRSTGTPLALSLAAAGSTDVP